MQKLQIKDSKYRRYKSVLCEKIGFFIYGIAVRINSLGKYCLFKSSAGDRIKDALSKLDKKEDIGGKIIDYDEGIADVISEPIETLFSMRKEVDMSQTEVLSCIELIEELHKAWLERDDKKLSDLFNKHGYYGRLEE